MLAATAIEHDLCLVSRNVRDVRFTGTAVLNPWDEKPAQDGQAALNAGTAVLNPWDEKPGIVRA